MCVDFSLIQLLLLKTKRNDVFRNWQAHGIKMEFTLLKCANVCMYVSGVLSIALHDVMVSSRGEIKRADSFLGYTTSTRLCTTNMIRKWNYHNQHLTLSFAVSRGWCLDVCE